MDSETRWEKSSWEIILLEKLDIESPSSLIIFSILASRRSSVACLKACWYDTIAPTNPPTAAPTAVPSPGAIIEPSAAPAVPPAIAPVIPAPAPAALAVFVPIACCNIGAAISSPMAAPPNPAPSTPAPTPPPAPAPALAALLLVLSEDKVLALCFWICVIFAFSALSCF